MSDELEQIRRARMQELRAQSGANAQNAGSPAPGGAQGGTRPGQDAEQEMRTSLMSQILEASARERLSRVEMVRPERARQVEELLIRMAQSNQLRGRVSEPQLVQLLDQISAQEDRSRAKIVYNRRDSDDDDDFGINSNYTSGGSGANSRAGSNAPNSANNHNDDDDDDFFD